MMMQRLFYSLILLIVSTWGWAAEVKVLVLLSDKVVVTVDGKRHILKKGVPSQDEILLISTSLREETATIAIDGKEQAYPLNKQIYSYSSDEVAKKPQASQSIIIAPDSYGMYEVSGTINGFSVNFVVDTGATLISMNSLDAKRIGLDYKLEGRKSIAETASGITNIYVMNLKRVQIGDIMLRNVRGAVHDGNFPTVILLGMSFLSRLNMNREGRVLKLTKEY